MKISNWKQKVLIIMVKKLNGWLLRNRKSMGINGVVLIGPLECCLSYQELYREAELEAERQNKIREEKAQREEERIKKAREVRKK